MNASRFNDIYIRSIINRIKKIESLRDPPYELPSDYHLEKIAEDIMIILGINPRGATR
jgi:hypothetical protein